MKYFIFLPSYIKGVEKRSYLSIKDGKPMLGTKKFADAFDSIEEAEHATSYIQEFTESFLTRYGYPRIEEVQ